MTPELEYIVQVDRSISLHSYYPDFTRAVHPERERTGPAKAKYDLREVILWLHDLQKKGHFVKGMPIYKDLKDKGILGSCLGLHDGLAIQRKHPQIFYQLFGFQVVFLWRSVIENQHGDMGVPCLLVYEGKIVIEWYWLTFSWRIHDPALLYPEEIIYYG